jgi:glycosyltransferase involved in cell wall biosynthesis
MPAYNAGNTLVRTHAEVIAQQCVDLVIVVDDHSSDATAAIAEGLEKTVVVRHAVNKGYGANQKTCYRAALQQGADIIIMVHPDYQYTPQLIPAMASMIGNGLYHCVLGSRILGGQARKGGMPLWRYVSNRVLTLFENVMTGAKLSEYHTGYRAYSAELLQSIVFENNSNDFIFDNQLLIQVLWCGYTIAEVSCPTRYFPEASSINFWRSARYGLGCVLNGVLYRLACTGVFTSRLFTLLPQKNSAGN